MKYFYDTIMFMNKCFIRGVWVKCYFKNQLRNIRSRKEHYNSMYIYTKALKLQQNFFSIMKKRTRKYGVEYYGVWAAPSETMLIIMTESFI